jgi:ATP-dependent helicase/nuclease subunit B
MSKRLGPKVYSIAAHRGFADALVAGLVPRYRHPDLGLAKVTLLLPSTRAQRIITEAFIRHAGEQGEKGLLMPRMAVIGDLDLDESLGPLLDPLGVSTIPRAVEPTQRWLTLAKIISEEMTNDGAHETPEGAVALRLARDMAATMDRLLVEEIEPKDLLGDAVLNIVGDLSDHWVRSLRVFAEVQTRWLSQLDEWGAVDAATRRNALFAFAEERWRKDPPQTPIIAAGVTSASPALARALRQVAQLPQGAVVLPDLDLNMDDEVWQELGAAGASQDGNDDPIAHSDAVSHPQYHLKLLLNRMSIAREEVQPWHRKGLAASAPERSKAVSAVFLPPKASRQWVDLPAEERRLSGVSIMHSANPEEEAQAIAVLVREALEEPGKRVAVITPDRGLARRVVQHLRRWNIEADDSAGRPLNETAAGRLLLLLAEVMGEGAAPVSLMALAMHPLVDGGNPEQFHRGQWLSMARILERDLRGPRPKEGLEALDAIVAKKAEGSPQYAAWWARYRECLSGLMAAPKLEDAPNTLDLAEIVQALVGAAEALSGEKVWARDDGRALARFVEDLLLHARSTKTKVACKDCAIILRDAMEQVAVRPPYGGHPRVAIYGLLEARMSRAEKIICGGLSEGIWPPKGSVDAVLAPAVLRALGVPGADFRIGLSAHDLAGAMGAPEVVLSYSARDEAGPVIPSRFVLRVKALLGDLGDDHEQTQAVEFARALAKPTDIPASYERPMMRPSQEQRKVGLAVTALDRLRGDPFQFYAASILRLRALDGLEVPPSPAWQGIVVHEILDRWHKARLRGEAADLPTIMDAVMEEENAHPLMRGLWQPRLERGLQWVESQVGDYEARRIMATEQKGHMLIDGVRVHGRADRIDRLEDGNLAIVDYKTGNAPSSAMVTKGFALQLGLLGLIARSGGFGEASGEPSAFEYWSLAKSKGSEHGFGYVKTPLKEGRKKELKPPEDFLASSEDYLRQAIGDWITGDEPFTAKFNPDYEGYTDYDQLMRLEEWLPRLAEINAELEAKASAQAASNDSEAPT